MHPTEAPLHVVAAARSRVPRAAMLVVPLLLGACSVDSPLLTVDAVPTMGRISAADRVALCHKPGQSPGIIEVAGAALRAHLGHGDYVTTLLVNHDEPATDDGVHFRRIADAIATARAGRLARGESGVAACRITIVAAADRYEGTTNLATGDQEQFPLIIDVPDVTLRGALAMEIDGSGRATGTSSTGLETVLAPITRLPVVAGSSTPLIIANGHPSGSRGNGLIVEGFVFTSGPNPSVDVGGQGILGIRVNDIIIRGNRFEAGFTETVDLRASSGDVLQNHLRGTAGSCDVCLAAPGRYRAIGNRLLTGGVPGITTSAVVGLPLPAVVEPYTLPETAEVWSEVRNNEVRDHLRTPVGVGIRVETVGTQAPNVRNTVHSIIQDNLLSSNRFGIIIHAGFPVNGTTLVGDANVTLGGNVIENSCQTKVLVTFSRHQRSLGLNTTLPYLQNSTYALALNGDVAWTDVWFDHPASRGNALVVDGTPVANGSRQFYSAAGCPGR